MIYAKLSIDTKTLEINNEYYCAYCGKKLVPDTEIDEDGRRDYYHCDCESAKKEIALYQKIKDLQQQQAKLRLLELDTKEALNNIKTNYEVKLSVVKKDD